MEDLISVIVPVYNVEQYLERCINSIVNQTYKNLEIILIDDGSTDSSGSICDTLCTSDNRILVIHQDNGGLSCARNTGIDHSRGNYLIFVDSDDWIDIRMIEKLYSRIIKDNSRIAFCDFAYVDQQGNEYYDESDKTDHILDEYQFWHDYYLKKNNGCYIVSWAKLIRRDVFANGIRFRVGKIHEDEFIIHELINHSNNISFLSEHLYYYFQRATSIMYTKQQCESLDVSEALLSRCKYFQAVGYYEFAEKALLHSIFPLAEFAMVKRQFPDYYERYKTLHKTFQEQYRRLFAQASLYLKLCGLLCCISPYLYQNILNMKSMKGGK